jgi:preprotein translocase subunit YajC
MNFYVMLITAWAWLVVPAVLAAQETAISGAGAANGGANPPPAGGGGSGDWLILFLMPMALVVFMMLVMRPQQKDQKQRDKMLSELKKNDRVVTTAGILGKVSLLSPENKTVKLVIDEKSGSCMTVTMSSIARVLTGEEKGDLADTSV